MHAHRKYSVAVGTCAAGLALAVMLYVLGTRADPSRSGSAGAAETNESSRPPADPLAAQSVELSAAEFEQFKVKPVGERVFTIQRETVGSIDFNLELSVAVFPPFQGKVIALFARAGDEVTQGVPLYTIDSPDLVQAESSLISTAGTLELTTRALKRAKQLYEVQGISQKELEQTVSDQQAAEAAHRAARDAVRIFGKTDEEMDRIVAQRKVDSVLVVRSPITGRVTARNGAPGLFTQPGTAPAPYTVADVSIMWMLANVTETDFPLLRLGQEVDVSVNAYPGRVFHGKIVNIGASVDPATRRVSVRSEVADPKQELRSGMFATFVIRTGRAERSPAVPVAGVVREGDGTMTVWVTGDRKRLVRRAVKIGLQQDGFAQILDGLRPGELVATEAALYLNNALTSASR